MRGREIKLYDDIVLVRDLRSDSGAHLPCGTSGHVVEILGPGEFILEFRVPDPSVVGDRIETALAHPSDVLTVEPHRPYPVAKRPSAHLKANTSATFETTVRDQRVQGDRPVTLDPRPRVCVGQVYRHFKGNLYLVLAVADYTGERSDDGGKNFPSGFVEGTRLVVYVGLYDNPHGNRPCVRPEWEWFQQVTRDGCNSPRFMLESE